MKNVLIALGVFTIALLVFIWVGRQQQLDVSGVASAGNEKPPSEMIDGGLGGRDLDDTGETKLSELGFVKLPAVNSLDGVEVSEFLSMGVVPANKIALPKSRLNGIRGHFDSSPSVEPDSEVNLNSVRDAQNRLFDKIVFTEEPTIFAEDDDYFYFSLGRVVSGKADFSHGYAVKRKGGGIYRWGMPNQ